jgi:hypothetical protein
LKDHGALGDQYFFLRWKREKTSLANDEVTAMVESKISWVRGYTFQTFPMQCPPEKRQSLQRNLDEVTKPLP